MSEHDEHGAGRGRAANRRILLFAVLITLGVLGVEVIGGILANSVALLSDAGHVLTDALALILGYTALYIAERPASPRRTFGYYRIEILAALVNGAILIILAALLLRESFLRFMKPEKVLSGPMLVTAGIGLAGNLLAVWLLAPSRGNLNMRGAFLHVLGDTLSSVAVLIAGGLVLATGWTAADAVAGALIAVVIIIGALRLLKESVDILLEACPIGISGGEVEKRILGFPEVHAVHDLHIWSITSGMHALSGHVVLQPGAHSTDDLLGRLQMLLKEEFDISHTTFQIETQAFEEVSHVHT